MKFFLFNIYIEARQLVDQDGNMSAVPGHTLAPQPGPVLRPGPQHLVVHLPQQLLQAGHLHISLIPGKHGAYVREAITRGKLLQYGHCTKSEGVDGEGQGVCCQYQKCFGLFNFFFYNDMKLILSISY